MNDLVLSPALRLVPVIGDGMVPTLRPLLDYALCLPVHSYQGEGIYLVSLSGGPGFYRVDALSGRVRLLLDNPVYQSIEITNEEFDERVLAIVLADIRGRVPADRWERLA